MDSTNTSSKKGVTSFVNGYLFTEPPKSITPQKRIFTDILFKRKIIKNDFTISTVNFHSSDKVQSPLGVYKYNGRRIQEILKKFCFENKLTLREVITINPAK